MLNIPENIKELFRSDNNRKETKKHIRLRFYEENISLLFPDDNLFPSNELFPIDMEPYLTIENDMISTESFVLTESLCESENLAFGECNSSKVEITVADVMLDVTGKEFIITVEVGGYELAMGIYCVESFIRQADRRMKKITAYDRMRKFQKDVSEWYQDIVFPLTLKQFRDSLCNYIGIAQIKTALPLDNMQITKTIEPQQLSGLDVLQAICEINGCFGHFDKTGLLKYINLASSSMYPSEELFPAEDLYPTEMQNSEKISHYKPSETTYEDYLVYGIEKVQIRQEEGDVGAVYGQGDNGYIIQGNFLVYGKSTTELLDIAATFYDIIKGCTYRPCKISCPAYPWVEVGDGILCYTSDDIIETYCIRRTTSGIQCMEDVFEATGGSGLDEDFGIETQIIQLEGKAAVIKRNVEEVSVRVTNLKEYTEAQFKVTAEEIVAEVKRAKEAEAKLSIRADEIEMSVTKEIDRATEAETLLASRIDITAEQIEMEVKRATVAEGQLSSNIRLTAEQIVAEVKRAQEAESQLKIKAGKIEASVADLEENTNSRLEITEKGITTISANGWISSRIEQDPTKITFKANKLIVDSTNFKLDRKGNATFSGKVEGASIIGGTIDIGGGTFVVDGGGSVTMNSGEIDFGNVFYVSDEYLYLGDFKISNDETNVFRAKDGSIVLQTVVGGPLGKYPSLQLKESNSINTLITGHHIKTDNVQAALVSCDRVRADNGENLYSYFYDIELGRSWWGGDSITDTVRQLWEDVEGLSDQRAKRNIIPINGDEALAFLLDSNPVTFQYKADGSWSAGFIAQEVDEQQNKLEIYFPLVGTDKKTDKYKIKYKNYIPLLVAAIKNLHEQINTLKSI